jgi:hypothetical protein
VNEIRHDGGPSGAIAAFVFDWYLFTH